MISGRWSGAVLVTAADRTPRRRPGPLAGVRVADFGWVGVGALATRLLADFGAEIIKIEDGRPANKRLDMSRRAPFYKDKPPMAAGRVLPNPDPNASGMFNNYNRNKLAIGIDARVPRGRALIERVIAKCSVVSENFAPGVMERWGLTYERLRELSPEVIFARMSGFGHSGPYEEFRSYGPVVQAVSGLTFISGLPGREPSGIGLSYMDNQAGYYAANALLTAIYHRDVTGRGTLIDQSAVEAGISLIGPLFLDVTANGRPTRRPDFPYGNRLPGQKVAPHGVFPAEGEDRWIAIGVFDDEQWRALRLSMGDPGWAADLRYQTADGRHGDQDALEAHLAAWTRGFDRHALMHRLQAVGVPACAVQSTQDLVDRDPQLAARGLYFELDHPVIGVAKFEGIPAHFSRMKPSHWRSAPLLGEDTEYVLKGIVGVDDAEYEDLRAEGVIT